MLRIIAGILGVPLGELQKRDQAYQLQLAKKQQRSSLLTLGAVLLMIPLLTLTAFLISVFKEARMMDTGDSRWHRFGSAVVKIVSGRVHREDSPSHTRAIIDLTSTQQLADQAFLALRGGEPHHPVRHLPISKDCSL